MLYEDDDDRPVGRVVHRREALTLLGGSFLLWLAGCSAAGLEDDVDTTDPGTCVARPQLTEGPYYVDENLNRSDIRSDSGTGAVRPGAALALTFNVTNIANNACAPLENAIVDVWHCDALGNYSDVGSFTGQNFLRGYQITDANGVASFTTIYPGWYAGRAVHIHFKVRSPAGSGRAYAFTSQLFFDDDFSLQVYQQAPYAARGPQNVLNARDGIYAQGGPGLRLAVTETSAGYAATFNIALYVG